MPTISREKGSGSLGREGVLETCCMCRGLRGHDRLKAAIAKEMQSKTRAADEEVMRLQELFRCACWYNFETQCKKWVYPWYETVRDSNIMLEGACYELHDRHGHTIEIGRFPTWYSGSIENAPPLPIQIVKAELAEAKAYAALCESRETDAYEYAPGGKAYEQLLENGEGVRLFKSF